MYKITLLKKLGIISNVAEDVVSKKKASLGFSFALCTNPINNIIKSLPKIKDANGKGIKFLATKLAVIHAIKTLSANGSKNAPNTDF
jgi:hypothetical protein